MRKIEKGKRKKGSELEASRGKENCERWRDELTGRKGK